MPKLPKIASLLFFFFAISSESSEWWSWFFACRWTSKFPTSWFQHFGHQSFLQGNTIIIDQHGQAFSSIKNNKFAVSLQYSKKRSQGWSSRFCMQINIKIFRSWHYHFWWKWPDMSKVGRWIGRRIFLQYIKKKVLQLFLCSIVM